MYNVNNLLHHKPTNINKNISGDYYTVQDLSMIGKLVRPRYRTEKSSDLFERYYKDDDGWHKGYSDYFIIVRYDTNFPFKSIMVSRDGKCIVANSDDVKNMLDLPDVQLSTDEVDPIFNGKEQYYNPAINYNQFEYCYKSEKVYIIPNQVEELIGKVVLTEYMIDWIEKRNESHYYDESKVYKEPTIEEIRRMLEDSNPSYSVLPDEIIIGFQYYYNRFSKDDINTARRSKHFGIIMRADIANSDDGYIVVMEFRDNQTAFICQDEANFFHDTNNKYSMKPSELVSRILNMEV